MNKVIHNLCRVKVSASNLGCLSSFFEEYIPRELVNIATVDMPAVLRLTDTLILLDLIV